jgi:hypothetical protein
VENMCSCFCHHYKGHLISLLFIWNLLKIMSFLLTSFVIGSLELVIISKISRLLFSLDLCFVNLTSRSTTWCKWW